MNNEAAEKLRCPDCKSVELYLNGLSWCGRKHLQRYVCNHCGRQTFYPLGRPVELKLPVAVDC